MKKRFRIDPFRWLFYHFVKTLVLISFRLFYSKQTKINIQQLRQLNRPFILVSNHPSTMMDPLNPAKEVNGIVFFLANAGMFKHWFTNWFFSTFYCIKIERPSDVNGRKINNTKAFEMANDFLVRRNGILYVAAEGTSQLERRIRPIKTGTARIAFAAEASANFDLGLTILPVGLTYSDPMNLGGEVIINVGKPLAVKDYQAVWQTNNRNAVYALTEDIQQALQALVIHTDAEEKEVDVLSQYLETIDRNENQLSFWETIQHSQKRLPRLKTLFHQQKAAFTTWHQQASSYFDTLQQLHISDKSVLRANTWSNYLYLVIGLPFFLFGYINNLLPIGIPSWLNKKMDIYPGYAPAVKTMAALVTVPLFYWLQSKLLRPFFPAPYWQWIYVLSLIPLGLFAWKYMQFAQQVRQRQRFDKLEDSSKKDILQQRKALFTLT